MPVTEMGDPRLQVLFGRVDSPDADVRPTVRPPGRGVPPALAAISILLAGVLLFVLLNTRRISHSEPAVRGRASDFAAGGWSPPPPLYIPPAPAPVVLRPAVEPKAVLPAAGSHTPIQRAQPQIVYTPQPATPPAAPPPRATSGAALVIDAGSATPAALVASPAPPAFEAGTSTGPAARMRASAFANRSMTVPQGHLIAAVLETGFDSTKPGFARAVVSRDVRGFDGQNILIPRGSRLIGSYKSGIARGENRAVISWTRLIRPDGITIAMDTPSVDILGRSGIPARVDNHFFGRLGEALLQTTMNLGQAFAGRFMTSPVLVVPGGAASAAPPITSGASYEPNLTVAPGKSISVFVAHDLDFSAAGSLR